MPLLPQAIEYAVAGWPVIPLRGKIPITTHGSKDWMVKPADIAAYDWHGIGLCTGHLFFVVDIDGPIGRQSWANIVGIDDLPVTPTVRTKNGIHHYFLMPKRREIKNRTGVAPGVDIRGAGGYVVAPPSPHPDGGGYEWIIDWKEADLADAPKWLLRLLTAPAKKSKTWTGEDKPFDLSSVARIETGGRNSKLYSLACAAFAKGKPIGDVTQEIEWINANRCAEPLREREINVIIRSASKHST